MRFKTRVLTAAIAVAVITSTGSLAGAVQQPHDQVVSANPENWTPHALDGDVKAITQVGSTMVVGGNFTRVSSADGATVVNQPYVFAFDAVTGDLKQEFNPQIVGGEVNSIVAHPDGDKVYLGGAFSNVNGPKSKSLALVSLATGDAVTPFKAPAMNGRVLSMQLTAGRLLISGTWSSIGGTVQGYIASLNPPSGAVDPFMSVAVTGKHNGGHTAVSKFDVTPDGTKLVAMGNFTHIDGQPRRQLAVLDLLGTRARVADWQTLRFEAACAGVFETYTRDIDIDPTGTYFVIVTTGAYRAGLMCDSASRWELGRRGTNQQPSWIDYTGGDTLWSRRYHRRGGLRRRTSAMVEQPLRRRLGWPRARSSVRALLRSTPSTVFRCPGTRAGTGASAPTSSPAPTPGCGWAATPIASDASSTTAAWRCSPARAALPCPSLRPGSCPVV